MRGRSTHPEIVIVWAKVEGPAILVLCGTNHDTTRRYCHAAPNFPAGQNQAMMLSKTPTAADPPAPHSNQRRLVRAVIDASAIATWMKVMAIASLV